VEEPTAKIYNDKVAELKTMTKEWLTRADEYINRPRYLKELEDHFNHTKHFIAAVKANHEKQPEDDRTFTDKQIEDLVTKYEETVEWKNTTVAKQEAADPKEEPILTGKKIAEKAKGMDIEVQWMIKKAKTWKPKPPPKEEKDEKKEDKKEDEADEGEEVKAEEETSEETTEESTESEKTEEPASENEPKTEETTTEKDPTAHEELWQAVNPKFRPFVHAEELWDQKFQ